MTTKQSSTANQEAPFDIFGDLIWARVVHEDPQGGYVIFEDHSEPQCGPPLHRHSREDEAFCILEGDYLFEVDGVQFTASAGSSASAPRGTTHTFQNIGTKTGRMLVLAQPAGLEAFFAELAGATVGMAQPDMSIVVPIFQKHGLEILGPPLAARPTIITANEVASEPSNQD